VREFVAVPIGKQGAAVGARPAPQANDKEEQARREKRLAEFERVLEKEEWAASIKKVIAAIAKELEQADRIEVFWLDSSGLPKGSKEERAFHGYKILSDVPVEAGERRKEVASFLGRALHWNHFRMALCFNPRHGVRAVIGKRTLEFLICFECWRVSVFGGERHSGSFALSVPAENLIEQVLYDAERKAKKQPSGR
jgi:hypothetical protein